MKILNNCMYTKIISLKDNESAAKVDKETGDIKIYTSIINSIPIDKAIYGLKTISSLRCSHILGNSCLKNSVLTN